MASFLITDVRIFDGQDTIDNGSVLVQNGRIARVAKGKIGFDGRVISKPGHTILPGLIDAHVHINPGGEYGLKQGLRFGVTTQCDLGNAPFQIPKLRQLVREGDCSDIKAASMPAGAEGGWPEILFNAHGIEAHPHDIPLTSKENARAFIKQRRDEGVDYIKLIHESGEAFFTDPLARLSAEVQKTLIDEAHSAHLPVVAHAFCLEDTIEVLSFGIDGTAHTILDKPPTSELVAAYRKRDAFCTPTLSVIGSTTAEGKERQEKYAHDPRAEGLLEQGGSEHMCQCLALAKKNGPASIKHAIQTVKMLKEAGIDILCGTDSAGLAPGTAYGLSVHQELALLVESCGFSPAEAIRAATVTPAKRFNFPDRGQVREGMRADLLLVEGNPLNDIDHLLDIRAVWVAGELCSKYHHNVLLSTLYMFD